jgi:hypothetical protein
VNRGDNPLRPLTALLFMVMVTVIYDWVRPFPPSYYMPSIRSPADFLSAGVLYTSALFFCL